MYVEQMICKKYTFHSHCETINIIRVKS